MASKTEKTMTKRELAKKRRKRIIIFAIEVIALLVLVAVFVLVNQGTKLKRYVINEENIEITQAVQENETLVGYTNIALFGVDSRVGALGKGQRTDTIMVASINEATKDIKLVSVYRDTYLNTGDDYYAKANSAYASGGPEAAISMLNLNLDLNITDYVTVGFAGLVDTIDALGGVWIDVDEAEISHLNNYAKCIAEDLGIKNDPVEKTGYQLLTGLQATAYCRIRYTAGNDFKRAARQREVLLATADVAKQADISTLNKVANNVFEEVYTSLTLDEILTLLAGITEYDVVDQTGFPFDSNITTAVISSKGDCVIPISLEDNVKLLQNFLFDSGDYQPSSTVKAYSAEVENQTSGYISGGVSTSTKTEE